MKEYTIEYWGKIYKKKLPFIVFRKDFGIHINTLLRGPILEITWGHFKHLYICFWTRWFAPRLMIWLQNNKLRVHVSYDP